MFIIIFKHFPMQREKSIYFLSLLIPAVFFCIGCKAQTTAKTKSLQLIETVSLPQVTGRIDHLSFNHKDQIIFVAALGNNTVEVVDLRKKKIIHTLRNLSEPQGIIFLPQTKKLVVANGGNGTCNLFDSNFTKTTSIQLGDDADNVRYDDASNKIFVGYGKGGIAVIDANSFKLVYEIKFNGHPESFQIDKSNDKMYVNVPDEKQVDVIDLSRYKVATQWKVSEARSNFPMALDQANHRLFIGCRNPAKLLVLDTETGKVISSVDIDGDCDDVFYNPPKKEIYVSCGSGYIDVINQIDANKYKTEGRIASSRGARTSLLISELSLLIVAAPATMSKRAQLLIYKIK